VQGRPSVAFSSGAWDVAKIFLLCKDYILPLSICLFFFFFCLTSFPFFLDLFLWRYSSDLHLPPHLKISTALSSLIHKVKGFEDLGSASLFFYLDYETIGTAATPGLLCQPRVIMKTIVESMIECRLAGETEVLGENLPQHHFCPSQNPTCPPGFEPGPPRWEAGN
jgi:hypothetical protein